MPHRLLRSLLYGFASAYLGCVAYSAAVAGEIDEFRNVPYVVRDKKNLLADVFVPKGAGPFPGVLCVHGGAWMTGTKAQMEAIAVTLAQHGYAAATIDYRLAPQFVFPAQIEDCRSAVRWLRSDAGRYKIDPQHIAGFGYSAGAHLVALLGTTDASYRLPGEEPTKISPRLQAVVAGGAPCDFRVIPADNRRLAFWLGGSRAEKPDAYALASPLKYVSASNPPMFFYHGQKDSLVPKLSPEVMVRSLTAQGVRAELFIVPEAGHIQAFRDPQAIAAAIKFLDEEMKSRPGEKKARAVPALAK